MTSQQFISAATVAIEEYLSNPRAFDEKTQLTVNPVTSFIGLINGREYLDGIEVAEGREEYSHYYGYKAENVDFVNAIINGTEPLCTIADAAKSMDMAELMLEKKINN